MHGQIQSSIQDSAGPTSNERQVLDLGDFSKHKRAHARRAFDSLPPGGSLEVVARRKPGQLFFELQCHYGLDFYWWPLERGPVLWRVMLARPALGIWPTVTSMMGADHRRLNQHWNELETDVELCRIESIRRHVGELSLGARRYIDIEEALLFPLLEAQTRANGATATMRSEHHQIEHALDQFDKLRQATDCAEILRSREREAEPVGLFENHCHKEEAILYPVMEIAFNPAEERELLPVIQAFEI
jgi:uncharacterized protein (DUF2249 family)/hemerythrin-like domain-containing protein